LSDAPENARIIKSTGKNIIKRCHHRGFQALINETVCFEKYQLPAVEGVCSGVDCGYIHEDEIVPFKIDTGFKNIFYISPDEINACIDRILQDMRQKVNRHGYLPHNFMFIFPVVSEKNTLLSMLYPAVQQFWVDFFSNPESYTESIMENLKNNNGTGYWQSKIDNKENDNRYYQYIFWHRSEYNQPINLKESVHSTKSLSIHSAKGNGCECVYLLGLSEFTLACHTGGIPNTLVYNSLFHVGMTRQKKYLFVGIDGSARDDVCMRFGKYYESSGENEPYIKNITGDIRMKSMISTLLSKETFFTSKETFFTKIQTNIMNFENYRGLLPESDKRELVDWGDHIIRRCTMKFTMDRYLWNIDSKHQLAKIKSLLDKDKTQIVYHSYSTYKTTLNELYNNIQFNINNRNKPCKMLIVPILIFQDSRTKTDYYKYKEVIKTFCDRIIEKLKKREFIFCAIECIIYCHLMEMIQHPYNLHISIMDIYRIISCYDDCYIEDSIHNDTYKCKCSQCFKEKPRGFVNPHNQIHQSVMNHHKSIERMKQIIESYHTQIQELTSEENITYTIDKSIKYHRNEFYCKQMFEYIGYSNNYTVFMILTPQFNLMNLYDILMNIMVKYFFLQNQNVDSEDNYINKTTYVSIITLDSPIPIIIQLTDLFSHKMENLKSIMKMYLVAHFKKEHNKLFDFFMYHSKQKSLKGITDKSDLLYVCDIMKRTEKVQYGTKIVDERVYKLPEYITDCFTEMDKKLKKDRGQRLLYKDEEAFKEFIIRELEEGLTYAVDTYLDIFIEDNPL
jgi:hypothetical protein